MASSGMRSTFTAAASALLVAVLVAGSAFAAPSKGGVKAPTNLRVTGVTGVTSYSVSLAWDASSRSRPTLTW